MAITLSGWMPSISPATERKSCLGGLKFENVRKYSRDGINLGFCCYCCRFTPSTSFDSFQGHPPPPSIPILLAHFSVRGPLSPSLLHLAFTITLTIEGIKKCFYRLHISQKNKIKIHRTCLLKKNKITIHFLDTIRPTTATCNSSS